jgi:hypothetical protein
LTSLQFTNTNILAQGNAVKVSSNILINIKNLEEVVLNKCGLDQPKCKILADAIEFFTFTSIVKQGLIV